MEPVNASAFGDRSAPVAAALLLGTCWLAACGEERKEANSSFEDVAASELSVADVAEGSALDDTDRLALDALDKALNGLQKTGFWSGYPLMERPLYLVHRSVKGNALHGLLIGVVQPPPNTVADKHGERLVYRSDAGLKQLGTTEQAYAYAAVAGVTATFAAYSVLTVEDHPHFLGPLAQASFVRMMELEAKWEPVEGCGVSKYPRHEELIALTLLEDALLAEIVAADAVTLPQRMTEIAAVRERRLELDPYTARIDNDGEVRFGAPYYAALRVPVIAGVRDEKSVDTELVERLGLSMTLPLEELDQHLLWDRPVTVAAVMLGAARRLGLDIEKGFAAGKSVHGQWIAAKGLPNAGDIALVKARHDFKAIAARAKTLMAQ